MTNFTEIFVALFAKNGSLLQMSLDAAAEKRRHVFLLLGHCIRRKR